MRIISENYVDISALDSSPVNDTVNNLKSYSRDRNLVTDVLGSSIQIRSTLGSQAPVSAIVLGRHNFETGTTIRIELYDDIYTTTVYDSGILTITALESGAETGYLGAWGDFFWGEYPFGVVLFSTPNPNYVHWIPSIVNNVLSIRITIDNVARLVKLGRLIIGKYVEPTYTISYGHTLGWVEKTKQYRASNEGSLRSTVMAPNKKFTISLNTINEEDRSIIQNAFRYSGLRKDLFISLFPENSSIAKVNDYSGIVKLSKIPSISEYAPLYYKSAYIMEEV